MQTPGLQPGRLAYPANLEAVAGLDVDSKGLIRPESNLGQDGFALNRAIRATEELCHGRKCSG